MTTAGRQQQVRVLGRFGRSAGREFPGFVDLKSGRKYVLSDAIADLLGCSRYELHYTFRPIDWGVPGHWRWLGGSCFYAVAVLPGLVAELRSLGEVVRADRLQVLIDHLAGDSQGRGYLARWEEAQDE